MYMYITFTLYLCKNGSISFFFNGDYLNLESQDYTLGVVSVYPHLAVLA